MKDQFTVLDVTRALGVAPSTGSIISNLLNARINPENCRSIEYWPLESFDLPPQGMKVLAAVASLLDDTCELRQGKTDEGDVWFIEWLSGQPTVVWYVQENKLALCKIDDVLM